MSSALAQLDAAVDVVLAESTSRLDDEAVVDRARVVERVRRRLAAVDHQTVVELEVRAVGRRRLLKGTAGLLSEVLRIDLSEARRRVSAAAELGPRTSMTGEDLEPARPATARAQANGDVSAEHAVEVSRALKALPARLGAEVLEQAEEQLAGWAQQMMPGELAQHGTMLQTYLDPDGTLTDDANRARRRALTVGKQGPDGMTPVRGVLDPTCAAFLAAAFAALAKPTPDGDIPDERTNPQRQHDALSAVCRSAIASPEAAPPEAPTRRRGKHRGLPVTVIVTMTAADLDRRAGQATTATGGTMPVADALTLAGDARWIFALLDEKGQPLYLSHTARLASAAQRHALNVRDKGCTRPGCTVPAAWCEVHHVVEWQDDGPTDLDNLVLVCSFDHHRITDQGFHVALRAGRVEWTAPKHLDPEQVPRVNTYWHPDIERPAPPPDARAAEWVLAGGTTAGP